MQKLETKTSDMAKVFYRAFQSLEEKDKDSFLVLLSEDKEILEDLYDLALIEQRKNEPDIPFSEILKEHNVNI